MVALLPFLLLVLVVGIFVAQILVPLLVASVQMEAAQFRLTRIRFLEALWNLWAMRVLVVLNRRGLQWPPGLTRPLTRPASW